MQPVPNVVAEIVNSKVTIYWDKPIKTDRQVSYKKADMVVIDREENTWYNVNFAILIDHYVKKMRTNCVRSYGTIPGKLSESIEKF